MSRLHLQVLPIWEGTSSVMSLDVVRALQKTKGEALVAYKRKIERVLDSASAVDDFKEASTEIRRAVDQIMKRVSQNPENLQLMARDLTVSLAHTYIAALLIGKHKAILIEKCTSAFVCSKHLCCLRYGSKISHYDVRFGLLGSSPCR